jgi:hypothetical protein
MQSTVLPRSCCGSHREEAPLSTYTPCRDSQPLATGFGVDGKPFVHLRHNRSCNLYMAAINSLWIIADSG